MDDRTWIVLPFENVARVADIDWLRDASVNLLYLDMSRWSDIKVVDDERVSDLMREAQTGQGPLGLEAGIGVARRAGASKLVMGDLLKVGNRTQVVAKVFDVRTRQRLRSVRQETNNNDSLMAIFGRLARAILAADPPSGTHLGAIGTTSLEAYRAYASGITSLNRVDLDSAQARFSRALAFDSTFALAHYKLSVVYGWINPNDPRRIEHSRRANQLSGSLPARERALILGQSQTSQSRWGESCQTYANLIRGDSTDVEAWYNLGECNYHDQFVEFTGGDTTKPDFRSSWNTAMMAFRRALELDPTYHLAYSHIPDILTVDRRVGCRGQDVLSSTCAPADQYIAMTLTDGDSLLTRPIAAQNTHALTAQMSEAVRRNVWGRRLAQNREFAQAWVNAGPDEARARTALGRALLRSGLPNEAAREFALGGTPPHGSAEENRALTDRVELLFKLYSMDSLARFLDSLANRPDARPNESATFLPLLLGRWRRFDMLFGTNFQGPPVMRRFFAASMQAMQGAPPADLLALEIAIDSLLGTQAPAAQRRVARTTFQMLSAAWTMDLERSEAMRDADTTNSDPRFRVIAFAIRRDTAALRRALVVLDSGLGTAPRDLPSATGYQWSADAHLLLGDTAGALAQLRTFEDRLPHFAPDGNYVAQFGNLTMNVQTWGRTLLRLADLAAARGDAPTAIRNYRRIVALWSTADAAFQPSVTRAREALARLGG